MRYAGTLYYEAKDDELRVASLILRADCVAIQATTTWAGEGNWSIDAIAPRVDSGLFVAANALTRQATKSNRCRLELHVVEVDAATVSVKGRWIERGGVYPFDGELEACAG